MIVSMVNRWLWNPLSPADENESIVLELSGAWEPLDS